MNWILRVIATIGLVAILLLGAWGIVQIVFNLPSFLADATSSVTTLFTGNHTSDSSSATSNSSTTNTTTKNTASTDTKTSTSVSTGKTGVKVTGKTSSHTYSGTGNLKVIMVSTGVINRSTGQYTANATPRSGDRVGVMFMIENTGTNIIPAGWSFTATLPCADQPTYTASSQQTLYPTGFIYYTLGFDLPTTSTYGYTTNGSYYTYYNGYGYYNGYSAGTTFGGTISVAVNSNYAVSETTTADNYGSINFYKFAY